MVNHAPNHFKIRSEDKYVYCTLFDKNYVVYGVALIKSLLKYNSKIYILCLDDVTQLIIKKLFNSENIIILKNIDFSSIIKKYEKNLSYAQKCWVSQPFLCQYILDSFKEKSITYIDSDCYFFSDPKTIFKEIGNHSSAAVPHRYYHKAKSKIKKSGKYCVQFNYIKNNSNGRAVLNYWLESCLKYNKNALYSYPGQRDMDNWEKFNEFKSIENIGVCVAPWNSLNYSIDRRTGSYFVDSEKLISFHFHGLLNIKNNFYDLGPYHLNKRQVYPLYKDYIIELKKTENTISIICDLVVKNRFLSFKIDNLIKYVGRHIYNLIGNQINIHNFN